MRTRAIYCALSFGLRPWWMYEGTCHYAPMTYRQHVWMNLRYAWRWLTRRETADDIAFEREINGAEALAPPPSAPVHVHVALDGRELASVVTDAIRRS